MKEFLKNKRIPLIISLTITLILTILSVVKINYDITSVGYINKVESVIEIEDSYLQKGSFNTTSVFVNERCTIMQYLLASMSKTSIIDPTSEIVSSSDIRNSKSGVIQKNVSITNAIICAYEACGMIIDYQYNGVIVHTLYNYGTLDLEAGDIISKVDGIGFSNQDEFLTLYNQARMDSKYFNKELGICSIPVTVNGVDKLITSTAVKYDSNNNPYPVFGFEYYDFYTIVENSTYPKYTLNEAKTTGPSGGLMQTLAVYNALTEFDYTYGLTIAGTGTIEVDGSVGAIGGMYSKIFTAYYSGVDIFFVPYFETGTNSNYKDAIKAYEDLGSPEEFIIVPVSNFSDAISFLESYGG